MIPTDLAHLIFTFLAGNDFETEVNRCQKLCAEFVLARTGSKRPYKMDFWLDILDELGQQANPWGLRVLIQFKVNLVEDDEVFLTYKIEMDGFLPGEDHEFWTVSLKCDEEWDECYEMNEGWNRRRELEDYVPRGIPLPDVLITSLRSAWAYSRGGEYNVDGDGMAGGTMSAAEASDWLVEQRAWDRL